MERDLVISEKINQLKQQSEKLNGDYIDLVCGRKYVTNLMVDGFSLRTCKTKKELAAPFMKLYNKKHEIEVFEQYFGVDNDSNNKILGYTWDQWVGDFKLLMTEIEIMSKKNAIVESIKKLERFYSEDKRTTDNFNKLLDEIAKI